MKNTLFLLLVSIISISMCFIEKTCKVEFDYYIFQDGFSKKQIYEIHIPKDYEKTSFESLDAVYGDYYTYNKSTCIYLISDDDINPNRRNIVRMSDSVSSFRFQNNELLKSINELLGEEKNKLWPDTLIFEGKDEMGLYWKDILIEGNIRIGYYHVPKKKKDLFDNCMKSVVKID